MAYNLTRSVEDLLDRIEPCSPSFTVHLHPDHWTLNSGSKFLYNNQVASLLDDIRAHRIPVDFLELFSSAGLPFYDGCLVVELLDYRPQRGKEPGKPEKTRVVLHPNPETLWSDICLLSQKVDKKWSDKDALEIEARILLATAPPLCLDPDPHLTRIVNHVLRVSTPTVPVSLKRKAAALDPEEDESEKARRIKMAQFMNPRANRSSVPNYRILDAIKRTKAIRAAQPSLPIGGAPSSIPQPAPQAQAAPPQPPPALTPAPPAATNVVQETSPKRDDVKNPPMPKPILKTNTEHAASPYTRPEGQTPTSVSQQPANQYHPPHPTTHSSSPSIAHSPISPHVYNAQPAVAADITKRVASPAQMHNVAPSPKPPPSQSSPRPQPVPAQQAQPPMQVFQPPAVPQIHYAQTAQMQRNVQAKVTPVNGAKQQNGSQPINQAQANQRLPHAQNQYPHYMAYIAQQQQHQPQPQPQQARPVSSHTGRSTPQGPPLSRSPMISQNAQQQQRNSPLVANQRLTSRSPMPLNPQQQIPQQLTHTQQYYNAAAQQSYNAAHLRMMQQGASSSLQHAQAALPTHLANSAVQQSVSLQAQQPGGHQAGTSQDQTQSHPQAQAMVPPYHHHPMFYAAMGMNYGMQGQLPYGWPPGVGRGIPGVMNGQPVSGMTSNAQHPQMQVGVGKPVPGSVPNR